MQQKEGGVATSFQTFGTDLYLDWYDSRIIGAQLQLKRGFTNPVKQLKTGAKIAPVSNLISPAQQLDLVYLLGLTTLLLFLVTR